MSADKSFQIDPEIAKNYLESTSNEKLIELSSKVTDDYLELAENLFRIKQQRSWPQEYISFKDYYQRALNFSSFKVRYYLSVYEKFIIDLQVSKDLVKELGFSKCKLLISKINYENKDQLIELAKSKDYEKLKEYFSANDNKKVTPTKTIDILELEDPSKVDPDPKNYYRVSFTLAPEQLKAVYNAFNLAKGISPQSKGGFLFEMICLGYALERWATKGMEKPVWWTENIKKRFGLDTIVYKDMEELKELLSHIDG